MKFDLDKAWREAVSLLKANLGLLATIAGVFYFLPYTAATSFIPELSQMSNPAAGMTPEAMIAMFEAIVAKYWWLFLILIILGGIASLAMLALMRQRGKPTVGEALGSGLRSIATYLGAQVLQAALLVAMVIVLVGLPAALGSRALSALGMLVGFVLAIYLVIKLVLVSPVIAIEGERNPVAAMRRSWALTKGSSLRLLLFFVLLAVAFIVISSVISLIATLMLAFASSQIATFGMSVIEAGTNAIAVVVGACVLAAIHGQLSRQREPVDVGVAG